MAAANLALVAGADARAGLEGPALGTAVPFFAAFPFLLRLGLRASGASLGELARRAWAPNYVLGALLAVALLVGARRAADGLARQRCSAWRPPACCLLGRLLRLVLARDERALARGLLRR